MVFDALLESSKLNCLDRLQVNIATHFNIKELVKRMDSFFVCSCVVDLHAASLNLILIETLETSQEALSGVPFKGL